MKNASNVRLSLRKLCIAMMAVGPIAVLPSPLLAVPPPSAPYTVTNGSAVWSVSGASATLQLSDKSVLVWNNAAFNIAAGDTYNFTLPSGGAVLNKVGYQINGQVAAPDDAIINGTLFSTGRVFVLANGNISIGDGANITTVGGLVLSTRVESSDFSFTTGGNLTFTGNGTGNVTIGGATVLAAPQISGNLEAVGNTIVSNRANITGDAIYRSILANSTIELAATGNLGVSGNLTVITNNSAITAANAIITGNATGNQTASFSTGASGNNSITLNNPNNDFEWVTINAPGTQGNVWVQESNIVTLGASTVGGSLRVNAGGSAGSNAIATNGALAVTGTSNFTTATDNSAINIGSNSTFGGLVNATASSGNAVITINATGNMSVGDINAGTGNRSGMALTAAGGALTIAGALSAIGNTTTSTSIALTGGTITQNGTVSLTQASGSNVSYNATAGAIAINGAVTAPRVVINSSTANGAVTQSAAITTSNATATSSINAGSGNVSLNSANSFAAGSTLQVTGGTVGITNTQNTVIGTSNVTGNLTLALAANNTLSLGTGSGTDAQNITVGGVLTASTSGTGTITDGNYTRFNIFGGMNLTTANGDVTLDAATANGGLSPTVQFGQVNINAGTGVVSVAETTSLNLGNITGSALAARSVDGGIIDSGNISVGTGTANFTVSATQAVALDGTNHTVGAINVIGGTDHVITVGSATRLGNATVVPGNLTLTSVSGNSVTLGDSAGGSVSVGNLTVNSGGAILVDGGVVITGTANLTAADTGATSIADTNTSGRMQVAGVTTLSSAGTILLDGGQDFSSVVLNGVSGNTTVYDLNNVTISGNATGAVNVRAGANSVVGVIAAPWALTLGNLNAGSLDARAQDGGGGISGNITQAAGSALHIENTAAFAAEEASIIVANNGNSFGRVEATVAGAAAATKTINIVEDGILKVGTISNARGNSTVTSRFGSIVEDTLNNVTVTNNGTLTLNAVNGSVLIGNTTHSVGSTSGNIVTATVNAPNGAVALINTVNNIALGNINANQLTVTTSNASASSNITQSGSLKVFAAATFVSAGNIVLSNTSNNFGRVSLTTSGTAKNITITEGGTLNLGAVSMPASSTGNFTATSANGDIIDTGLGGVRPGGTTASPGSGIVTLSALNGNIVLDDPTTDIPTGLGGGGLVFNGQNVTISVLGSANLVLGSANLSSVAGNLTVTSATGNITNAGDLNIAGQASFQTGNGNITLGQSGNRFGTVRFIGNQVSISQVNDMNILKGSTAIGPAQLASTGSYVTIAPDGSGVVSFGNTVGISASSSITLPDALQAVGQLTVNAAGTKDLSALSKAGDLNNLDPANLGTGTYVPPQP